MRLRERLGKEFTVTAELEPARGADPAATVRQAEEVRAYVNAVNITDSPMASLRMNSIVASHVVERETGIETTFHFTCRDRNVLALQSELLGAAALGLGNVLCLTGDPPSRGDHPDAQGVFEVTVVELIAMIRRLNDGKSLGKDLDVPTSFTVAAAANPGARDLEVEVEKFHAKLEAGASFFQTQPVFSADEVLRFREALGGRAPAPVLYGILPVRSAKMGRNVQKWCNVPDELIASLENEGEAAGLRWARRTVAELRALGADGIHVYPLGKTYVLREILESDEETGHRVEEAAGRSSAQRVDDAVPGPRS